jgi:hypothetical protein
VKASVIAAITAGTSSCGVGREARMRAMQRTVSGEGESRVMSLSKKKSL